jgi:hypothetical protein
MIRRALFAILAMASMNWAIAATITATGAGGSIPDYDSGGGTPGVFTSDIVIVNPALLLPTGNNVTVTLLGLGHDWSGDLTATLTYIGGTVITQDIFNQIGVVNPGDFGFSSNFGDALVNYSFRSDFTGDLWTVAGALGDVDFIPGDEYWTSGAGSGTANSLSSAYNGLTAAAIWRLTITDNAPDSTGVLTGWQLDLEVADGTAVPEPTSLWLVGLAVPALLIRRWAIRG